MKERIQPAVPGSDAAALLQRHALAGHERWDPPARNPCPDSAAWWTESWQRSASSRPTRTIAEAPLAMDRDELEEYRRQHPLATIMPVITNSWSYPAMTAACWWPWATRWAGSCGWRATPVVQRRAESMMFVAGADWSEASVGTSAPGTALALGRSIQISGAEHFKRSVHPWSCTAVPFHDPDSGAVLGVVDITGTETAVAPHTLSLVEATVAAAQAQLRVERLQLAAARQSAPHDGGPRLPLPAGLTAPVPLRKAACTATASSSWAGTRPCSASKAAPWRFPPGTAKSWHAEQSTRTDSARRNSARCCTRATARP